MPLPKPDDPPRKSPRTCATCEHWAPTVQVPMPQAPRGWREGRPVQLGYPIWGACAAPPWPEFWWLTAPPDLRRETGPEEHPDCPAWTAITNHPRPRA